MTNWKRLPALVLAALIGLSGCGPGEEPAATRAPGGPASPVSSDPGEAAVVQQRSRPGAGADEREISVIAETLPYAEVGDELVYGHFVFPADMLDPLPGLIVIHEWAGLNDDIRRRAERIAAEGFVVLAIDLFRGKVASTADEARPLMINVVENPELANQNVSQAYEFLLQSGQAPRIGVLGWDFGGGWALNAAMLLPDDLDAAVIFYGQVIDDPDRLATVNVPVLGLFGEKDQVIPVENVQAFDAALAQLDKNFQIEVYPGAVHEFASPGAENYDAEVADKAWQRTMEFLGQHLLVVVDSQRAE